MVIILTHYSTTFFEGGKTGLYDHLTSTRAFHFDNEQNYEATDYGHDLELLILSYNLCVFDSYEKWVQREKYPNDTRPPLTSKLSLYDFLKESVPICKWIIWICHHQRSIQEGEERINYKSGKIARPVLLTNTWSNGKSATAANVGNPRLTPVLPTKNVMAATKLQLQTALHMGFKKIK